MARGGAGRSQQATAAAPATKRRSRRGRGGAPAQPQLTSSPTGRAAYAETRRWLLERHGPVCAYCDTRYPDREITLDHVAPRRGQSAYDRRENLVLACKRCNTAKADMPLLAFLFRRRERAASLARYGDHLSGMLRDLVRQLAGDQFATPAEQLAVATRFAELDDDVDLYRDSPYRDVFPRAPSAPGLDEESPYRDI